MGAFKDFVEGLYDVDNALLIDVVDEIIESIQDANDNVIVSKIRRNYYDKIAIIYPCNPDPEENLMPIRPQFAEL